ncbi:hypothetical protein FXE51_15710 [Vibrio mimicus]|uniref:hypothetical protein n=1 Tax=Vibrio mimicus TaxID=674 RepID=UPI0011D4F7A4|nr:hypothetical protein [Vibrio mimicus]EIK2268901.1 hypothetical protein [Vibrio cholerae]TXZ74411.1 hypothetical protein FXE51_15710 [Vibrio mimicus]
MNIAFSDNYDKMKKLIEEVSSRDMNEADTRYRIINFVLSDFLFWPENRLSLEEYINPGYADYILKKENGDELIFIEAKKEGIYFEIPVPYSKEETSCYIPIKKLITDTNIKSAINQVRQYCFDSGCEYACITNGHEWIFFKAHDKGKRWDTLNAFVIRSLNFFINEYTKAENNLSYTAITEYASLPILLSTSSPKDRPIFYPKEKILTYSHSIRSNRLAQHLRPIASYYFGVISDDDNDFMSKCYVSQRDYSSTFNDLHGIIQDSLTPYMEDYGISQLDDTGKGGQIGGKLTKNIKYNRKGEVLVLFGGKGAGKSTFIKRLLHHTPPKWLKDHSVVSIIDLLKVPENEDVIRSYIWRNIISNLDQDLILSLERDELISILFKDKFEIARRQYLSGLNPTSESYNIKLNELLENWKSDYLYCAKQLVKYWSGRHKGVIIVVDNTDQYSTGMQDFCFTSAQEISSELECVCLISMREERFHDSKIHGVLDAFQNSGFHISSPNPTEVFKKRLRYTIDLLGDEPKRKQILGSLDDSIIKDCISYLEILKNAFSNHNSPLTTFLSACAHGDTRLSLDLFRSFLLSGYTNVDEMINAGSWIFKIHQVLKPVMIPERYFYDEHLSDIPNMYQLRSNRHSSHFTALRILRALSKGSDNTSPSYHSVLGLKAHFVETFNMLEDFENNLDMLLKHGIIESNNRIDKFTIEVDSVKITNYGLYIIRELAHCFTYLDLVCTDVGLYDQRVSNYIAESSRTEYSLFSRNERLERVNTRLERANKFIEYLRTEELREKDTFSLDMPEKEMFTHKALSEFIDEKKRVMRSAKKQISRN